MDYEFSVFVEQDLRVYSTQLTYGPGIEEETATIGAR